MTILETFLNKLLCTTEIFYGILAFVMILKFLSYGLKIFIFHLISIFIT